MSSETDKKEFLNKSSKSITNSELRRGQDLDHHDSSSKNPNLSEINTVKKLACELLEESDPTAQDSMEGNLKVDSDKILTIKDEIEISAPSKNVVISEFHEADGKLSEVEEIFQDPAERSVSENDANIKQSDSENIIRCENVCESDNKTNKDIKESKEESIDKPNVDGLDTSTVELTNVIVSADKAKMNPNIREADLESIDKPKVDSMIKSNLDSIDKQKLESKGKVNLDSIDKSKIDTINSKVYTDNVDKVSVNAQKDGKAEDVEMRQTESNQTNYKAAFNSIQAEKPNFKSSFSSAESDSDCDRLVVDYQSQSSENGDLPVKFGSFKSRKKIESNHEVFECSMEIDKQENLGKSSSFNAPDQSTFDQRISPSLVSETSSSSDQIIQTSSENIQTLHQSDQLHSGNQEAVAMETDEGMGFGEMNLTAVQITPEEFENIVTETDGICDSGISSCQMQNVGVKQQSQTLPEDKNSPKSEKVTNISNLPDGTAMSSASNQNIRNLANMITKIKKEPSDESYSPKLISNEKMKTMATIIGQPGLVSSSSSSFIPPSQTTSSITASSQISAPKDKRASTPKPNNQPKKTPLRMISPKVIQPKFHVLHPVAVSSNTINKAAPSNNDTNSTSLNTTAAAAPLNTTASAAPGTPKKGESFNVGYITDILQRKHKIGNYKARPIPEDLRPYLKSYSLESCSECGDSFTSKDTLMMHEKRVSVTINYSCPICERNLTFYNKCTFLGHIRLHNKEKGQIRNPSIQVKADILSITLPPKDKMFQILEQNFSPMILASDVNTKSYYCTECYKDFEDVKLLSAHFGCSEVMCSFNYICNMCNMCFPRPCSAEAHKRCHSKLPPYTCPECGIVIEDHEEFRHHIKNVCFHFSRSYLLRCLNGGDSNCGFAGTRLNTFLRHLQNEHIQMKGIVVKKEKVQMETNMVFSCMLCSFSSKNKQILLDHMHVHLKSIQRNATFVFTCTKCPQHFSSKQQLRTHDLENHSLSEQKKGVYLCSTCNTVTRSYSKYLAHQLQAHEMINAEFYICQDCKCLFEDPDSLGSHKILCSSRGRQLTCTRLLPAVDNLTEHQVKTVVSDSAHGDNHQSKLGKKPKTSFVVRNIQPKPGNNAVKNMEPNYMITKKTEAENTIKKLNNAKINDQKSERYMKILPKQEPAQLTKVKSPTTHNIVLKIVKTTKHKCNFCSKEFSCKEEQEQHRKSEHSTFSCHLCGLTYDTQSSLNNHLKDIHEGTKLGYFCFPCQKKGISRKFSTSNALEKHLIFKHRISKARIQRLKVLGREEGSSSQSRQNESIKRKNGEDAKLSPVKRLRTECSGLYTCVKCNFSSEESDAFSAHIETHKTADASQCPECGLCFSVLPALKKHLFMVHKIRNADDYISKKGIKEPPEANVDDDEDEDEGKDVEVTISPRKTPFTDIVPIKPVHKEGPIGELECRVCYREFETVSLLKNHMRVHGMAFIRSRRLVPEVKTENEKDQG